MITPELTPEDKDNIRIPVILKDGSNGGKGSIHLLRIEEICNITTDGRVIIYETVDNAYHNMTTLDDVGHIFPTLFDFQKIDRSNYVQTKNIAKYDSLRLRVYFESNITKQSRFATIAEKYISQIRKLLGKENDVSTGRYWW